MDPISIGLGVVGLGMQLWGSSQQSKISGQQAAVSRDIAGREQDINVQKQQQMQLEARRSQLQNFRNAQRLRAQATNAAVNQGAQLGSGLAGGLAGVTDQATENNRNVSQGVQISQNIFDINRQISGDKMQMASLGGDAASAQGWSSLGGSLMKSGPIIGAFGKDLYGGSGGFNLGSLLMGGGSPSGYGR